MVLAILACVAYLAMAVWAKSGPNSYSYSKKQASQMRAVQPETAKPDKKTFPDLPSALPDAVYWPVPFTPQAPTANWDELHNEACEEASAIMAHAYFSSSTETTLSPKSVEEELSKLTAWEDKLLGYHLDTTSAETARMMEQAYGLKTKLLENFTEKDVKEALAAGKLVAISENGRLLGNPNYKTPGPIHHMLLLKGYDKNGDFITNDSGTKKGLNYPYAFDVIFAATADWDHAQGSVDTSKKLAIVIWK